MNKFKEKWHTFKTRWQQFSSREKMMVMGGSIIVFLFLFYALIWSPILNKLDVMRKQMVASEKMLAWIKNADNIILELKKNEHEKIRPDSVVAFLSIVKEKVAYSELDKALSQLKQLGPDSIEIHLQKVNFDQAIIFLTSLLQNYEIHISQFSATSLNSPGLTNISMVLKVNV